MIERNSSTVPVTDSWHDLERMSILYCTTVLSCCTVLLKLRVPFSPLPTTDPDKKLCVGNKKAAWGNLNFYYVLQYVYAPRQCCGCNVSNTPWWIFDPQLIAVRMLFDYHLQPACTIPTTHDGTLIIMRRRKKTLGCCASSSLSLEEAMENANWIKEVGWRSRIRFHQNRKGSWTPGRVAEQCNTVEGPD